MGFLESPLEVSSSVSKKSGKTRHLFQEKRKKGLKTFNREVVEIASSQKGLKIWLYNKSAISSLLFLRKTVLV